MILVLLLVTATFRPPQPAVGDLITIEFARPVTLDRSADYEIVSQRGRTVVVRTFKPRPFAIAGTMGNVRFRNLRVPVRSVLKPGDDLAPAPLRPPRRIEPSRLPLLLTGIAAAVAAAVWYAVWRLAKRPVEVPAVYVDPAEAFRTRVLALRANPRAPMRWAALADATRAYFAATRPDVGADLTTTQFVARVADPRIAEILHQGDLEKFSPWGAMPGDFDRLADHALELAAESAPQELAA